MSEELEQQNIEEELEDDEQEHYHLDEFGDDDFSTASGPFNGEEE